MSIYCFLQNAYVDLMILRKIPTETYQKFDKLNLKFTGYSKGPRIGKKLLEEQRREKGK